MNLQLVPEVTAVTSNYIYQKYLSKLYFVSFHRCLHFDTKIFIFTQINVGSNYQFFHLLYFQ